MGLSQQAFADVYAEHLPALVRYCRSILRDPDDAEDAAQSAMEKALRALEDGSRPARMRPWLFTIAQREALTAIRRRRMREASSLHDLDVAGDGGTEQVAATRERLADLLGDLQALVPRQRHALLLRELDGRSHKEIAALLDCTEAAAQQAVFEARRSLASFQEGRDLACDGVQRWLSDHDARRHRTKQVRAHLRDCGCCRAFDVARHGRARDLGLLFPGLGGLAAAGWLAVPAVEVARRGAGLLGGKLAAGLGAALVAGTVVAVPGGDGPARDGRTTFPGAAPAARLASMPAPRPAPGPGAELRADRRSTPSSSPAGASGPGGPTDARRGTTGRGPGQQESAAQAAASQPGPDPSGGPQQATTDTATPSGPRRRPPARPASAPATASGEEGQAAAPPVAPEVPALEQAVEDVTAPVTQVAPGATGVVTQAVGGVGQAVSGATGAVAGATGTVVRP